MAPDDYVRGRAEIERLRAEHDISRPFTFSYSASQTRILPEGAPLVRTASSEERLDDDGSSYAPASPLDEGRQRFIGSAAQLREDCALFAAAGVEQLVIRHAVPFDPDIGPDQLIEQLHLFAAEVLPFCREL
jgi:hypothetical protein